MRPWPETVTPVTAASTGSLRPTLTPVTGRRSASSRARARAARPAATMAVIPANTALSSITEKSAVTVRPGRGVGIPAAGGLISRAGSSPESRGVSPSISARPRRRDPSSGSSGSDGGRRHCSKRSASAPGCSSRIVKATGVKAVPAVTTVCTNGRSLAAVMAACPAVSRAARTTGSVSVPNGASTVRSRAA